MESFQSGNNPVYVFGALLTQRQFSAANFGLEKLNRPDPLNNFQSLVSAEQLVYDFGGLKNQVKAAETGRQASEQERKAAELEVAARVAAAYHSVTLAGDALALAKEALKSAEADEARASTVRAAGMATDADVLTVRVHVSAMKEQVIRRQADLKVAKAALNEALGVPLDTDHVLATQLSPASSTPGAERESQAVANRPELAQVRLSKQAAEAQAQVARAGYLPQIGLRGLFEADRQQFVNKGGANWMFMASLKWNLFDGNRSRAGVAEARHMAEAAGAAEKQYANGVRLEVRKAQAGLDAATERIRVTEAAVEQAEESLRILRNRYSSGMATVTDLLHAETAVLDAKTRKLAATYDQRLAAIAVEKAAGVLNGDSDVLN
jgi:outer membrane protein TolC